MPALPTLEQIIAHFDLIPLAGEGGLFRQTYITEEAIPLLFLPERYRIQAGNKPQKPFGTCIHYLLTDDPDSFSALHMLPTDEIWHFYLGEPVELLQLYPDGRHTRIVLGHDILNGAQVQVVVPHGVWMGARLIRNRAQPGLLATRYALMGMTMTPGYTDSDYVAGDRTTLTTKYPAAAELIHALTRLP